jgi:hypothetical protein
LTKPIFDIAPRTGYFHENGAYWVALPGRVSDVYVFAWHGVEPSGSPIERYPNPVDHRDVAQWVFYVVPTKDLPPNNKTISLRTLEKQALVQPISIDRLVAQIDSCTRL